MHPKQTEENNTRNTKGAANKAHTCCCGVDGNEYPDSSKSAGHSLSEFPTKVRAYSSTRLTPWPVDQHKFSGAASNSTGWD